MNLQEVFDSDNFLKSVNPDGDFNHFDRLLDSLAYRHGHAEAKFHNSIAKHKTLSHPEVQRLRTHADNIAKTYTEVVGMASDAGHSPLKLGVTRYAQKGDEFETEHPQFHKDTSWATASKSSPYRMEEPDTGNLAKITLSNIGEYGNKPGPAHVAYARKRNPMADEEKRVYEGFNVQNKNLNESIVKRGEHWLVMNSDKTRVLGKHESEKKAKAQLAAIEISKKKRGEMKEEVNYISANTQRLRDRTKEVKQDPNSPFTRRDLAFTLANARAGDKIEVSNALFAVNSGPKHVQDYINTGNPHGHSLSGIDLSGMEARANIVAQILKGRNEEL